MTSIGRLLSAAVLVVGGNTSIPVANAQNTQKSTPELSAPSTSAPTITDQKLDAAAAALQRVTVIQQTYRQRFAEARTPSEQEHVVAEANNALTEAVADQGLSVEEYNSIIEVAQNDPEIRGKVLQRMHPKTESQ